MFNEVEKKRETNCIKLVFGEYKSLYRNIRFFDNNFTAAGNYAVSNVFPHILIIN